MQRRIYYCCFKKCCDQTTSNVFLFFLFGFREGVDFFDFGGWLAAWRLAPLAGR
jgi:hypothetical protein